VSKIGAGKLTLSLQRLDLGGLVQSVCQRSSSELKRAECELRLMIEPLVIGYVDRLRLEQIVTNLLTNAVKFGAGNPIDVKLERVQDRARLSIKDFGIGIALEDQTKIFERFERAVSERSFGGMGLGLYIVKELVNAHGGATWVESKKGEGACFVVELPLREKE